MTCEGEIEPKTKAGRRKVPIARSCATTSPTTSPGGPAEGLRLRRDHPGAVRPRNDGASRQGLEAGRARPITLHECRHSFASLMIAAGVNAKALQTFMGHANISITFDRYGHLMPGVRG